MMPVLKRTQLLGLIFNGCLSWQERWAGTVMDVGVPGREVRKRASDIASAGLNKKHFLFDALECCLACYRNDSRRARLREGRRPMANLEMMIRDDDAFFMARVFAKLFRALLSTRRLEWNTGSKFSYKRSTDKDAVFYSKRLADNSSAAITLARRLAKHAARLALLIDDLGKDEEVFRGAVLGRQPSTAGHWQALLTIWQNGRDHLPIDKLWRRVADCDFSKECLEYDEFHHLVIETGSAAVEKSNLDTRNRADKKVGMLTRAQDGVKPEEKCEETRDQWKRVSRNWLCRGFRRRFYHWTNGPILARNSRGIVSLDREVDEVVRYIDSRDSVAYKRVKRQRMRWPLGLFDSGREQAGDGSRAAVRMATAGNDIDDIMESLEWPGGKKSLYEFFFLVATQRSELKVQECWNGLAGLDGRDIG